MIVYDKIVDEFKKNKIEVYSPGSHKGDCTSSYVVVKDSGKTAIAGLSSQSALYDILCYVPEKRYTEILTFVDECKRIMNSLYPMLIPTGLETPSFHDDNNKSYMVSVEYRNSRFAKRI